MDKCCSNNCFKLCKPVADCLNTLSVYTKNLDQNLYAVIVDKFDKRYRKAVLSTSSGLVVIDLTDVNTFPAALLNPYAGVFRLFIEDSEGFIQPFAIESVNYDCLEFEVAEYLPKKSGYLIDVFNTPIKSY